MKKAFTLAEILITLSIIGVIASMTIPSLVQDVQDAQLKTAWKKVYAEFDQATKRIMIDNVGSVKGLFGSDSPESHTIILNTYSKYLNFIKKCYSWNLVSSPNNQDKCWHATSGTKVARYLNGSLFDGYGNDYGNAVGAVLNNGTLLVFYGASSTCNFSGYCTSIIADVNGFKGPNVVGKDIFRAYVLKNQVKPWGYQGDPYENTCSSSGTGWGCSAKYLYQ